MFEDVECVQEVGYVSCGNEVIVWNVRDAAGRKIVDPPQKVKDVTSTAMLMVGTAALQTVVTKWWGLTAPHRNSPGCTVRHGSLACKTMVLLPVV